MSKLQTKLTTEEKDVLRCFVTAPFRIGAEYYLVKDRTLPFELSQNSFLSSYRRPTRWRLQVWKQMLKTTFKDLVSIKMNDDFSTCGAVISIFNSSTSFLETIIESENGPLADEDDSLPDEADEFVEAELNKLVPEDFDFERAEREFERLNALFDHERFFSLLKKEAPEEVGNYLKGFSKGWNILGEIDRDGNVHPRNPTTATKIYWFMLVFGDLLEKQKSVKHVYEIVLELVFKGNERCFSYYSFKQLCRRIHFTGASYRARKKRNSRHRSK